MFEQACYIVDAYGADLAIFIAHCIALMNKQSMQLLNIFSARAMVINNQL